jgi:hypothetical protein
MNYGICSLSVVPVRKEASDKSEMVTQLLFGEHFEVLDKSKQWRKIRTAFDDYEGWIDEKQFIHISNEDFIKLNTIEGSSTLDLVQIMLNGADMLPVVIGSNLPFFDGKNCSIGETNYSYDGHVRNTRQPTTAKHQIVETAHTYLNSPYLWGGKSPFGIDCSGFTQMVYKLNGIKLKRDAYQQAEQGYTLSFIAEAEPGDLVFFDNDEGKIIHVGILLSNQQIIHACGKVRVDTLDQYGIFNNETKKYSHKIRLIKRII